MARITNGAASPWAGAGYGRGTAFQHDSSVTKVGATCLRETWRPGVRDWEPVRHGAVLGGKYRLIERLGRGRQADVWRASRADPGAGGGEVALKVLPAAARDPRRRAQLRHEAERGTRLVGPSLLTTYEFGEADGAVFMAMNLVVGCTLADVIAQRRACRDGRGPGRPHRLAVADDRTYVRDVVALTAQVARAAAGAHAGRVVHRDIKPGNILVRRDHVEGVFLCDFGLARDLDVATPGQLRDGAGSPLYMAPERLMKLPADEVRGDVYALGVTLFEALTLSPPVDVPENLPPSLWASFLAAASPRRPSALWPSIPSLLESLILRSLSRDPSRRQPSADHFADDLERYLSEASPLRARRSRWAGA